MNNMEYIRAVEKGNFPDDPKVPLGKVVNDDRGSIINLLWTDISTVAVICSKKNTTRSNHWHRSNWHFLYVVSGCMLYCERNLDGTDKKTFMVRAGQMVFTAPEKVHQTYFEENTVLLNMCKNKRTDKEHREDCIPEQF